MDPKSSTTSSAQHPVANPAPDGSPVDGTSRPVRIAPPELARYIDHTLLKPEATEEQVERLCEEAAQHGFHSVCVNSSHARRCARRLRGTEVKVCVVAGFPLGAMDARVKAFEAGTAVSDGAQEIDMVLNVGGLKARNAALVREDILAVRRACSGGALLKVILETCLLSDEEKVLGCKIAQEAGADFVKTSTGFNKGGATLADVALMRQTVGPGMGVKAAGGVRGYQDAVAMIQAGASRLGTSAGVLLVSGEKAQGDY